MRLLCAGTLTGRAVARLAPRRLAASMARSTGSRAPAMTTCPGELKLTASTTPPWRGLAAGFDHLRVVQPQNGGHGAGARGDGLLHGAAAELHEIDGRREIERAGGHQGRELSQAMAADHFGLRPPTLAPEPPGRNPGREHGGLGALRGVEALLRPLRHQLARGRTRALPTPWRRCREPPTRPPPEPPGQHADRLRALSGKYEAKRHTSSRGRKIPAIIATRSRNRLPAGTVERRKRRQPRPRL